MVDACGADSPWVVPAARTQRWTRVNPAASRGRRDAFRPHTPEAERDPVAPGGGGVVLGDGVMDAPGRGHVIGVGAGARRSGPASQWASASVEVLSGDPSRAH